MQEKLRILSRRVHSNFQKTEIDTKEMNVKCKGDAFYSIFIFQWNIFFCFVDKISYPKMPFHNMIVLGTLFVVWEWRIFFFVPPFTVKSTISPCFIYEIEIKFVFKNLEMSYTSNGNQIRISNFTYDLDYGHKMVDTEILQIRLLLLHLYMPIRQIILDNALLLSLNLLQ